jgi:lipopolysaccharide/colanic/teichoic acid biosynthesis glycosyltransferase
LRQDLPSKATAADTAARAAVTHSRDVVKRTLDIGLAATLLVLLTPVIVVVAIAIKLDSRGPVLYRSRRTGRRGVEFAMLKFRKMYDGAAGPLLTASDDARLTRVGRILASKKLDEIPQLLNVLKGEMSLVGPRPEDPSFVERRRVEFERILSVRPGITGLSQLAFAREPEILDADDREADYERRILPQKLELDKLYTEGGSFSKDLEILAWTVASIVFGRPVAVHRSNGRLTRRRRSTPTQVPVADPARSEAA